MSDSDIVLQFWDDMHRQHWNSLARYFHEDARINWHNTNEQFTVDEFIRANAQYPGDWQIEAERILSAGDLVISVVRVSDENLSFHATSFFTFREGKVSALDEYWGSDEKAPEWRRELRIGKPIKQP